MKVLNSALEQVPRKSPITMRQLLTHTSGFVYISVMPEDAPPEVAEAARLFKEAGGWDGMPYKGGHKDEDFLAALSKTPLAFEPGSHYIYGLGYDVAGIALQRIAGQPLAQVMKERIFDPLGMEDTFFVVPPEKRSRFANLWHRRALDKPLIHIPTEKAAMSYFTEGLIASGGGGLCSTLKDYGKLLESVSLSLRGDPPRNKIPPILAPSTAALLAGHAIPDELTRTDLKLGLGQTLACQVVLDPALLGESQPPGSIYVRGNGGTKGILNAEHDIYGVLFVQKIKHPGEGPDLRHFFPTLVYQALTASSKL